MGFQEEPTVQETENELISKVRKQIEYYFSKENLQQDAFLASQMDASMSVAIAVVMKVGKFRTIVNVTDKLWMKHLVSEDFISYSR